MPFFSMDGEGIISRQVTLDQSNKGFSRVGTNYGLDRMLEGTQWAMYHEHLVLL